MKYYLDITLLPDSEITLGFIWFKVYQQVHIAFAEHGYESERKLKHGDAKILKNSKIAVSFPEYQAHSFPLGSKLRLFAQTQFELEKLNIQTWLNRLTDYISVGEIEKVPSDAVQVVFKQKRIKGVNRLKKSLQKKRDHLIKKFGEDFNPNHEKLNLSKSFKKTELPFIQIESQTSKKAGDRGFFKIFIEKLEPVKSLHDGYDCYGLALSPNATVPWF